MSVLALQTACLLGSYVSFSWTLTTGVPAGAAGVLLTDIRQLWTLSLAVVVGLGALEGATWGWAPLLGWLGVRSALAVAGMLYLAAHPSLAAGGGRGVPPAAFFGLVDVLPTVLIAWGVWRSCGWFHVEENRRWRVLLRGGGWVIAGTMLAELLPMLLRPLDAMRTGLEGFFR